MIAALGALLVLAGGAEPAKGTARVPIAVTVATHRGERRVPVRIDAAGAPVLPAPSLAAALGATLERSGGWADLTVARQRFRFAVGAAVYLFNGAAEPMAAAASVVRDTLYLPLQFVAEVLPRLLSEQFRYDGDAARLVEIGPRVAFTSAPTDAARATAGLKRRHVVAVDPGHGGVDPGNPGVFFPRGIREKDVTLKIGLLLRDELRRRGVAVRMTRTTDTLIALGDRGGYCERTCDLFVSLHVNSLRRRAGYTDVRGFETYYLAEARTEDAARVAQMENEAIRFESPADEGATLSGLDFILRDLQLNEHLRESVRVAELVQEKLGDVHPGGDRGVKQAGFMVLTTARRPAVLVELGYSTNRNDARLLASPSSQRRLASAIADAVVAYLAEYERKTGVAGEGTQ